MIRNDQVGDWFNGENSSTTVLVADTGNDDSNFLIAFHEAIEAHLCRRDGIKEADVDNFDANFKGPGDEPGNSREAPYFRQHEAAMKLERYAAFLFRVPWKQHEKRIDALFKK